MLIRNAEIEGARLADVRVEGGRIAAIRSGLQPSSGEDVLEGEGCALFPGLHDHHIHLAAYAAALASIDCGPHYVGTADALAALLSRLDQPNAGWLRGTGYHDSVAGSIDRDFLDRIIPLRPIRIQHRSGRLWIFNSAGLAALNPKDDAPLERVDGRLTGRLYDGDAWLRQALASRFPDLGAASRVLASYGITGVTDATPSNGPDELAHFRAAQASGELLQSVFVMGDDRLNGVAGAGPRKFHLHEADLPDFDETVAHIARCHAAGRAAAFHCVARTDLAFALVAIETAGVRPGDRIEHAGVAPPDLARIMRRLGVTVVTQPNFIAERGDSYLREVAAEDLPWLYPAASLEGIPIAGGADAPFGNADPWVLMDAAVRRTTAQGHVIGDEERLTPEAALRLFLGRPENPGGPARRVAVGEKADLVLLDRTWREARSALAAVRVKATLKTGHPIFRA